MKKHTHIYVYGMYRFLAGLVLGITIVAGVSAQVMTSGNYQIQSDSVNFAGGHSTSTNYSVEDTAGEIATGYGTSTNYSLHAGYQQQLGTTISMTAPDNVTLLPNIDGTVGGTANGTASTTVITNDTAGYQLTIAASSSPALKSGANSFADYTPGGVNPDFTFSVAAASSEFGFSPEGTDIVNKYKDNGAACNVGALDTTDACWNSLSTSPDIISQRASSNYPGGTKTTIKFRAESGASNIQPAGTYIATTTLTAIAL